MSVYFLAEQKPFCAVLQSDCNWARLSRAVVRLASAAINSMNEGRHFMRMVCRAFIVLACVIALPTWASAQASITGIVKDTSGAVLPGVTVEAASDVLIEKVRSAVTDSSGQYRIVDLRAGTYAVTFTLTGFGTGNVRTSNCRHVYGTSMPPCASERRRNLR